MSKNKSFILGIETSCDECSASVVEYNSEEMIVRSVATFSQIDLHVPFGGVVPEVASRNHLETIQPMIDQALNEARTPLDSIDAIAVTNRPGLVGALLVGVTTAKSLAYVAGKPLIAVNHLEGHACSLYLSSPTKKSFPRNSIQYPMLLLMVSGGHTQIYIIKAPPELWTKTYLSQCLIGQSKDDAAGEAFDKTAKLLGFPYPGGRYIDQYAQNGDASRFQFPKALQNKNTYDFSFSGLKTAVALKIEELQKSNQLEGEIHSLCASIQKAIVDALISKVKLAAHNHRCASIALVGGVAANSYLRSELKKLEGELKLQHEPLIPHLDYCTDNAAMIAAAGAFKFRQDLVLSKDELLTLNAIAYPES
jgi:N6-L-threonylcarbamoyladenine synthase